MTNIGFKEVEEMPEMCKSPVDYIDFWYSLKSFGESLTNSKLVEYRGVYFRKRKSQLTLCTYDTTSKVVDEVIREIYEEGYHNLRTWSWVNKDFEDMYVQGAEIEFWVDDSYSLDYVLERKSGSSKRKLKNKYLNGVEDYTLSRNLEYDEIMEMFEEWREFANERHFMVIVGHYKSYIRTAFEEDSEIKLLGFYDENDKLHGVAGWEVADNKKAQITFMKNLPGDNNFSTYLWIRTLEEILKDDVEMVFCGSTANSLKRRFRMNERKTYEIDRKKYESEVGNNE